MKLTEKQVKKVQEEHNKWKDKKCPFCHGKKWLISDSIFELREFGGGDLIISKESSIMPVIALICESCSHTLFLNAIKMGIIKGKEDKNGKKPRNNQ